jgi:hypothetical protein
MRKMALRGLEGAMVEASALLAGGGAGGMESFVRSRQHYKNANQTVWLE